jgi:hypothetical protein
VGVGGVGVDDVEESVAEVAQSEGVEVRGLADQVPFGLLDQVGVEVVGEVLDGADDHPSLVDQQVPGGERLVDGRVVFEAGGQLGLAVCLGAGHPGRMGPPVRHRGGPDLLGHPHGPGMARDPGFELGHPGTGAGELGQRRGGLGRVHRPQRGVGDLVEEGVEVRDGARHLVSWVRLCGHRHSREVRSWRQSIEQVFDLSRTVKVKISTRCRPATREATATSSGPYPCS